MTESDVYINKELAVMIGPMASGKSYHVNKHYIKNYQLISEAHIQTAMAFEKVPQNEDMKYAIMAVMLRAHMIRGLPIVDDEPNLTVESLFILKKFAAEHGYKIKGIIIDTPKEACVKRLELMLNQELDEDAHKRISEEHERFEEIKQILQMKHQNILDDIVVISYGGK